MKSLNTKKYAALAEQVGQHIISHKGEYYVKTPEMGYKNEYSLIDYGLLRKDKYFRVFKNQKTDRLLFVENLFDHDIQNVPSFYENRTTCYRKFAPSPVRVKMVNDNLSSWSTTDQKEARKLLRTGVYKKFERWDVTPSLTIKKGFGNLIFRFEGQHGNPIFLEDVVVFLKKIRSPFWKVAMIRTEDIASRTW